MYMRFFFLFEYEIISILLYLLYRKQCGEDVSFYLYLCNSGILTQKFTVLFWMTKFIIHPFQRPEGWDCGNMCLTFWVPLIHACEQRPQYILQLDI